MLTELMLKNGAKNFLKNRKNEVLVVLVADVSSPHPMSGSHQDGQIHQIHGRTSRLQGDCQISKGRNMEVA